ncbi:MAG TPA: SRPBCC family protein [Telluria sp.]
MPASCAVVFDAFHYHHWRLRWDSLVAHTTVEGGGPCPYKGAVTRSRGRGLTRNLVMRTEFITYQRPSLAAARMVGVSFPFTRWAASMKHEAAADGRSAMIYTYTIETGPPALRWLMEPIVNRIFLRQTRQRFARMQQFLAANAAEVEAWQRSTQQTKE